MTRALAAGLACLAVLAVSLLGIGVTAPVVAADSGASIDSVNVTPEAVAPGEPFTAAVTIRNAERSNASARITEVGVKGGGLLEDHDDLGTLGPGQTMTVPVSVTLEEPGRYELTAFVHARDLGTGQLLYFEYPVYVTVEEPGADVGLSVSSPDAVAGDETTVNVTVANGGAEPINSLRLSVAGDALTVRDPRRISPSLAASAEQTFSFDVRFTQPGPRELQASLDYRSPEGYELTVTEPTTFDVDALTVDGDLSATVHQNGSDRTIRASLENFGNVPLEDVVVRVEDGGDRLDRAQGPDVPPGETRTVTIDANEFPEAELELVATYEAAGRTESTSNGLAFSPTVESRIELTGLDFSGTGDRLTVSGDAANVGASDANSVLVRVLPTDAVTPVNPNREYFIGTIESSEFATFELTAAVDEGTAHLPVEVQYTVDGGRQSRVVDVDVSDVSLNPEGGADGSGEGGPPLLVAGSVLVAAGLGVAYWWRRRE